MLGTSLYFIVHKWSKYTYFSTYVCGIRGVFETVKIR